MDDWIQEIFDESDRRQKEVDLQITLNSWSQQATPEMFRRLVERLTADARKFAERFPISINHEPSGGVEIVRQVYPTFFFKVRLDKTNPLSKTIVCDQNTKRNQASPNNSKASTIAVLARTEDQHYYRLDGIDYLSEAEVSRVLLAPLFKSVLEA